MNKIEFIATIAPLAVLNMQQSQIPASLTIAQAALESGWGNSGLTSRANNLFGIKGSGPAGSVNVQTTEYVNGKAVKLNIAFRAYHNWGESVSDHSEIIKNGVSWNRDLYRKVIGASGITAAKEIAAAGYATDPDYAAKLIGIMDMYNLYQYDEGAKEEEEMSVEDKKKLEELEAELKELRAFFAERLTLIESRASMTIPAWAEPAVKAAFKAGLLDTPAGGSYDFYRMLTVLNRAGLLITAKEG
ncbi:glucosaminidase domain-containing protein [Paenibacillus sp. BR2-3]|uniref:glycoside hydrolase family 73 protein n=1 Tax=Paenibacillus sp. BR2-3 TaxID=3048494 RepID=UPI003977980B